VALWAAALSVGAITFFLRAFRLGVSWDIFVDEITYARISQSAAQNLEVTLFGNPFYLHPPLFFFLEGAYLQLIDPAGGLIDQIYDARYLNAAFAGLSAVVLFGIGRCLTGWPVGFAAALIFALDPFVIKMNSRNLIESSALLWVLLGYLVLFSALVRTPSERGNKRGRISAWRAIMAGVLFGLALLSKDTTAFVTLLPLGACFVLGWAISRRRSFVAGVVAVLVYLPYPLVVWAIGDWPDFSYQKFQGALRLAGIFHETGFNQEGGRSFIDAIISNLDEFATTYFLLGAGALSVLVLIFLGERTPVIRLFLAWVASAYSLLAYIVLLGALEEQFFYYLIVPAILVTVAAVAFLLRSRTTGGRTRQALLAVTAILAVAFVSWSGYVWTRVHFTPDNGYERVVAYFEKNAPEDSTIAVTSDVAQFLLGDKSIKYGTPEDLRENDVEYVVVSSSLIEQGYSEATPEFYAYVEDQGEVVYGFEGRSFGLTLVYQLPENPS